MCQHTIATQVDVVDSGAKRVFIKDCLWSLLQVEMVVRLWKDGFTVNDEEFRSYSVPENQDFLDAIKRGWEGGRPGFYVADWLQWLEPAAALSTVPENCLPNGRAEQRWRSWRSVWRIWLRKTMFLRKRLSTPSVVEDIDLAGTRGFSQQSLHLGWRQ